MNTAVLGRSEEFNPLALAEDLADSIQQVIISANKAHRDHDNGLVGIRLVEALRLATSLNEEIKAMKFLEECSNDEVQALGFTRDE
jgi:hypothetical protein